MPRGKLSERYVQDVAVEFLKKYYYEKCSPEKIFAGKELCVKNKFSNSFKRTDGLIAFCQKDKNIFVSIVEAKSYKTLHALLPFDNDSWLNHSLIFGLILSVLSFCLIPLVIWLKILISIITFAIGVIGFWTATMNMTTYRSFGVIDQIKNYPAHEKWIAFSIDAFNCLSKENQDEFEKKLIKTGIGLLIVSSNRKIKIEHNSATKNQRKDIIDQYVKCNEIRQNILAQ